MNNKHEGRRRAFSKIDGVSVNAKWITCYTDNKAHFLPEGISYHFPSGEITFYEAIKLDLNPFRYFNMWSAHEDFPAMGESIWRKLVGGIRYFQVVSKLKALKFDQTKPQKRKKP